MVTNLLDPIGRMDGDSLPVSAFNDYVDGTYEHGASAYEKRGTAVAVGIREKRIRPRAEFLKIRKSVSVRILDRIRQERHRPLLHLPGVGKSVTIRIPGMRIRIVPITIRIKLAAFSSDLLLPCWKYFNQP